MRVVGSQLRSTKIGRAVTRSQPPRRRPACEPAAEVATATVEQAGGSAPKAPGVVGLSCRTDVTPETTSRRSSSVGSRFQRLRKRVEHGFNPRHDFADPVAEAADERPEYEHDGLRSQLWPELFGDSETAASCEPEGYVLPQDVTSQIRMDVIRTQPKHFAEPECEFLQSVLSRFVAHNPAVGYCQGLNFIASVFLRLSFDVATTFRGLSHILETCCSGYHGPELHGYRRDMKVMQELSHQVFDDATLQRIKGLEAPLDILALDHFLTLTSRSWPLEATVRLWDLLLLKGPPALFASFLAVLELYAPPLLEQATDDVEPVHEFQKALLSGLRTDLDAIMTRTWELMELMPQAKIDRLREAVDKDGAL